DAAGRLLRRGETGSQRCAEDDRNARERTPSLHDASPPDRAWSPIGSSVNAEGEQNVAWISGKDRIAGVQVQHPARNHRTGPAEGPALAFDPVDGLELAVRVVFPE